jgi:hypothetical protein
LTKLDSIPRGEMGGGQGMVRIEERRHAYPDSDASPTTPTGATGISCETALDAAPAFVTTNAPSTGRRRADKQGWSDGGVRDGRKGATGRFRAQHGASYPVPEPRWSHHQQLQAASTWQHARQPLVASSLSHTASHRAYRSVRPSTCHVHAGTTRQRHPRVRPSPAKNSGCAERSEQDGETRAGRGCGHGSAPEFRRRAARASRPPCRRGRAPHAAPLTCAHPTRNGRPASRGR